MEGVFGQIEEIYDGSFPAVEEFTSLRKTTNNEYKPSLTNLIEYLKDKENVDDSLLFETFIISFFTTQAGHTMAQLLYFIEICYSSEEILNYVKWFVVNRDKTYYKQLHKDWKKDKDKYLLKFCKFILNYRVGYPIPREYCKPNFKLHLSNLFNNESTKAALIMDESYNLLVDFLLFFKPYIRFLILNAYKLSIFPKLIKSYRRTFDFRRHYSWYALSDSLKFNGLQGNPGTYLRTVYTWLLHSKDKKNGFEDLLTERNKKLITAGFNMVDGLGLRKEETDIFNKVVVETSTEKFLDSQQNPSQQSPNEHVFQFDLNSNGTLQSSNLLWHTCMRHDILFKVLGLQSTPSPLLSLQFNTIVGLVDPLTQPAPSDQNIISIDLIYEMFIGLIGKSLQSNMNDKFELNGFDWKFTVSFNMYKILRKSLLRLNCSDYKTLTSINNNNSEEDWKAHLDKWLPYGLNTQDLELVYMIDIMAVYTIYKLYSDVPIQLNPFLSVLISLWKNLSCIILLGLEIDRLEEAHETFDTPLLVRATIRGASALRSVIASILNNHVEANSHDFKHEPLNTFMSPHGRKLCQGALYADLRSHASAMLAFGLDLEDVTDLLSDLQAGDRFDEDIRYMFEYEYADYNSLDSDDTEDELDENEDPERKTNSLYQKRRCNCIFEDDKVIEDREYYDFNRDDDRQEIDAEDALTEDLYNDSNPYASASPYSMRSKVSFEFDYSGKDWRDIPRGYNLYYSPTYDFIERPNKQVVLNLMHRATSEKLDHDEALSLLKYVASSVKNEQDHMFFKNMLPSDQNAVDASELVTPDDIYDTWCEASTFEKMIYLNHNIAWRLMDEMLMCTGYRRVLIWYITHMELNHSLIHYIFELVMGFRGQQFEGTSTEKETRKALLHNLMLNDREDEKKINTENDMSNNTTLPFSRQGPLLLSDIENKMLLQEFFTNAAIYFSSKDHLPRERSEDNQDISTPDETEDDAVSLYSVGLMTLICFMVETLIKNNKFDFSKSECTFELQTLLMNWIGVIPEAQELFFTLKSHIADANPDESEDEDDDGIIGDGSGESTKSLSVYNVELNKLLPPIMKGKEENVAVGTLRNFMKKYSFNKEVPIVGRKVIYKDDKILPLHNNDRAVSLREVIACSRPEPVLEL